MGNEQRGKVRPNELAPVMGEDRQRRRGKILDKLTRKYTEIPLAERLQGTTTLGDKLKKGFFDLIDDYTLIVDIFPNSANNQSSTTTKLPQDPLWESLSKHLTDQEQKETATILKSLEQLTKNPNSFIFRFGIIGQLRTISIASWKTMNGFAEKRALTIFQALGKTT